MNTCYFDVRQTADSTQSSLASDIAIHLQTRQHLGKTVIVCEKPHVLLAMVRKHWLKRARSLQKERSSTINAEKILRLTNTITHMHHMNFVSRPPEASPNAHVFFITPDEETLLPVNTFGLYITTDINRIQLKKLISQLPNDALVSDYTDSLSETHISLKPKNQLEISVMKEWQEAISFLENRNIDLNLISNKDNKQANAIDDALDTLLGISRNFLNMASILQHAFELAQPLILDKTLQCQYDIVILLAHRVQALSPHTAFINRFTYDLTTDETFFLHDTRNIEKEDITKILAQTIQSHHEAGRTRLARALKFASY